METVKEVIQDVKDFAKDFKNRDIGAKLYHREDKRIGNERIHFKKWLLFEAMYNRPMDTIDNSNALRKLLVTEAIDAGHKNNQPESAKEIPDFIEFFEIDMTQFKREKIEDYKTFNDFFTREIKEEKRPVASPEDNGVVVSPADCRMICFNSLEEARDLFIKGEQFSFEKLLGGNKELADVLRNGSIANFRLCPQDYHRFHTPVSGTVTKITKLGGTTYACEPKAIKSDIDVLGDNEREVIEIDTKEHGKVAFIAIGAVLVGLVKTLVKEGQELKKGDELGFFHFGGSDIVVMFEKKVKWDDDLMEQSLAGIETYLKTSEKVAVFKQAGKDDVVEKKADVVESK